MYYLSVFSLNISSVICDIVVNSNVPFMCNQQRIYYTQSISTKWHDEGLLQFK